MSESLAFIKAQNLKHDENGVIISGSASINDTFYGHFGSYHSKNIVREKLGKVIWLSEDKKDGIFLSPTRGLVEYNVITETFHEVNHYDERIKGTDIFEEPTVHTVFGDVYLLLEFLKKEGMLSVLRSVFLKESDYQRVLCHILHSVLKDGSRISCADFISKSFASHIVPDVIPSTLKTDSRYFALLGDDKKKTEFFKAFIDLMRKKDASFGHACYVDSTPLPNDIHDNPFNALCCHGVGSSEVMTRLVLVLDEGTGLPVWFNIIPGNVLDLSTVMGTVGDVEASLDIEINSLVLDAGYVSENHIRAFPIGHEKTMIGRMPNRRGYPYKTLYWQIKGEIGKGKYDFVRKDRTYFGKRKEIELFGTKTYAYIYVDHHNALKRYSQYLSENEEEFEKMKDKDKDFLSVKYGYFVLISNLDGTPAELLSEYFGRTSIETVFKTSKEYLGLLPLSKWTDLTVRGKILHDILGTIALLLLRKKLKTSSTSTSSIFGKAQSLMCFRNQSGIVTVETPNKQVKDYYKLLGMAVPAHVDLAAFMHELSIKM